MRGTYEIGDVLLVKKVNFNFRINDILYFEYPAKDSSETSKTFLFQRLCGLPGDSVCINDKILSINGFTITDTVTIKKNYFVNTGHKQLDSLFKLKYNLTEGGEISNEFDYSYSLTNEQYELLKHDSAIKKIELKTEKAGNFDETCFPYSTHYSWNLDHYGKIYIPKKNDTLRLDTVNINLYASIIVEENNSLDIKQDSIFISGIYARVYVPRQNYFFVLADNRDNANDSRSWGFLAEKYIVGKAVSRLKKGRP